MAQHATDTEITVTVTEDWQIADAGGGQSWQYKGEHAQTWAQAKAADLYEEGVPYTITTTNQGHTMTPTDTKIESLRTEAAMAGDHAMVAICTDAISGDPVALAECAEVIEAAAAMAEPPRWPVS